VDAKNEWKNRVCPGCGDKKGLSHVETSSLTPAESVEWQDIKDSFIGLRAEQVFFSYSRCDICELLFCHTYFSQSQLNELYSVMPNNLMGEDVGTASKTQYGYAKQIIK
jgi:hypothetical protein